MKNMWRYALPVIGLASLIAASMYGGGRVEAAVPVPTAKNYDGIITNIDYLSGTITLRLRDGSIVTVKNPLESELFISVKGFLDPTLKILDRVSQITIKNKNGADAIPYISGMMPVMIEPGSKIYLTGAAFAKKNNSISIGDLAEKWELASDGKSITFVLPAAPCNQKIKLNCPTSVIVPGNYEIKVSNDNGTSNPITFTAIPLPQLTITTDVLPQVVSGTRFKGKISAMGGSESYVWRVSEGSLPPGLMLAQEACTEIPCRTPAVISGTPTAPGVFTVTLTSRQESIARQYAMTIVPLISAPWYQ